MYFLLLKQEHNGTTHFFILRLKDYSFDCNQNTSKLKQNFPKNDHFWHPRLHTHAIPKNCSMSMYVCQTFIEMFYRIITKSYKWRFLVSLVLLMLTSNIQKFVLSILLFPPPFSYNRPLSREQISFLLKKLFRSSPIKVVYIIFKPCIGYFLSKWVSLSGE